MEHYVQIDGRLLLRVSCCTGLEIGIGQRRVGWVIDRGCSKQQTVIILINSLLTMRLDGLLRLQFKAGARGLY